MRVRLTKIRPVHASAALAIIGLLTVCVGIALVYLPAALIVGGLAVTAFAFFGMDVKP